MRPPALIEASPICRLDQLRPPPPCWCLADPPYPLPTMTGWPMGRPPRLCTPLLAPLGGEPGPTLPPPPDHVTEPLTALPPLRPRRRVAAPLPLQLPP